MTTRLAAASARARAEQRPALITLVIPGFPAPGETDAVFDAMVEGGADIVEVEIPFSDPLADGATIQLAAFDAPAAEPPPGASALLARVRRCTNLPLAVGFGISRREHVQSLAGLADGVVVGSALMNVVSAHAAKERAKAVREYVEELSGRRRP